MKLENQEPLRFVFKSSGATSEDDFPIFETDVKLLNKNNKEIFTAFSDCVVGPKNLHFTREFVQGVVHGVLLMLGRDPEEVFEKISGDIFHSFEDGVFNVSVGEFTEKTAESCLPLGWR